MHALERAVKRRGRIVPHTQREIEYLHAAPLQLERGERHAPAPDILRQGHASDIGKHPLKMKRRAACDLSCFLVTDGILQMLLDVVHRPIEPFQPFHRITSPGSKDSRFKERSPLILCTMIRAFPWLAGSPSASYGFRARYIVILS